MISNPELLPPNDWDGEGAGKCLTSVKGAYTLWLQEGLQKTMQVPNGCPAMHCSLPMQWV